MTSELLPVLYRPMRYHDQLCSDQMVGQGCRDRIRVANLRILLSNIRRRKLEQRRDLVISLESCFDI